MTALVDYYIFDLQDITVSTSFLTAKQLKKWATRLASQESAHFLARCWALKKVLANYVDVHWTQVDWSYDPLGKPYCTQGDVCFSLSHSGNYMAVICCPDAMAVGVDLERIRAISYQEKILKRFMVIDHALKADDPVGFLTHWTRFEAWVKCGGKGVFLSAKMPAVQNDRIHCKNAGYFAFLTTVQKHWVISLCAQLRGDGDDVQWQKKYVAL